MEYKFNSDHDDPKDSQVIIALTGTPQYIAMKLLQMHNECTGRYGKPVQGQVWSSDGQSQVSTPVWQGRKY